MPNQKNKKIVKAQFICMFGVLLVHTYNVELYQIHADSSVFFEKLLYYFEELMSQDFGNRIAVPVFMMISAFLFYRNIDDYKSIGTKIKKRMKSIGIPYLIWNSVGTVYYLFIARIPVVSQFMNGTADQITLGNILGGVFLHKYYYPFWFLSRLLLFTCLSPVAYSIVQRKVVGILTIICFVALNCFHIGDHYTINTALFYLIGAYAACHSRDRFENQSKLNISWYWLLALLCVLLLKRLFDNSIAGTVLALSMPILFWPSLNIVDFRKCKVHKWETRSFFIFCAHTFVLEVFEKIIGRVFRITRLGGG